MKITLVDGYVIEPSDEDVGLKQEEIKTLGDYYTKTKEEVEEDGSVNIVKYIPEEDKKKFADEYRVIFGLEKIHG